ncbi:MAG: LLM class flavin-dependent oxidoreductase, partial [Myxococcota bacterium]|nr:LLM class flavin-dependent oxidoreductase [Myxococcota bacterium]
MKLGLAVEYAARGVDLPMERIKRCEEIGYDSVWTAEAYGSDAITPLAFIAAHTKRIRLGTGVIQLAARTPAMTAMQLGTLDALAGGGRVIGGLGVSGPQIVEGWYGAPWGDPLERMRDYVSIMNKIFARDGPVVHDGKEIRLPFDGHGSAGMGKPLKSILHFPERPKIYLGTG